MTSYTEIIIRSTTTGKFHLGPTDANYTHCNYNGQSTRNRRNRPATAQEVSEAQDANFCQKCFGKEPREQVARTLSL